MKPGTKPKPAAQRRREGNPAKRAIREGVIAVGEPSKPAWLRDAASQEWDRVVPLLVQQGVAKAAHESSLAAMCEFWRLAEQAREVYEEEGLVEAGSTGQMVEHPMIGTWRNAVSGYLRIAAEFGLTASAAMRVEVVHKNAPEPFAEIGPSPRQQLRRVK